MSLNYQIRLTSLSIFRRYWENFILSHFHIIFQSNRFVLDNWLRSWMCFKNVANFVTHKFKNFYNFFNSFNIRYNWNLFWWVLVRLLFFTNLKNLTLNIEFRRNVFTKPLDCSENFLYWFETDLVEISSNLEVHFQKHL